MSRWMHKGAVVVVERNLSLLFFSEGSWSVGRSVVVVSENQKRGEERNEEIEN